MFFTQQAFREHLVFACSRLMSGVSEMESAGLTHPRGTTKYAVDTLGL